MASKQWHRDRIEELKLLRKISYDSQRDYLHVFIALGLILMAFIGIYFPRIDESSIRMFTLIGLVAIIVTMFYIIKISKQEKNKQNGFDKEIWNRYDILLGRKK